MLQKGGSLVCAALSILQQLTQEDGRSAHVSTHPFLRHQEHAARLRQQAVHEWEITGIDSAHLPQITWCCELHVSVIHKNLHSGYVLLQHRTAV